MYLHFYLLRYLKRKRTPEKKGVSFKEMNMALSCPVVFAKVDENQVRFHALLVTLAAVGFVWSGSVWFLALLVYDFAVRVLVSAKGSPFFWVSRGILSLLAFAKKPVDAGPKRFAAKIGLLFVAVSLFCVLGGYIEVSTWLIGLLALFAGLEAACGFCVGCQLYSWLSPLLTRR